MTLRQAVEYLYWEGASPDQIVRELRKHGHTVDPERVLEMIAEMEGDAG